MKCTIAEKCTLGVHNGGLIAIEKNKDGRWRMKIRVQDYSAYLWRENSGQ